MDNKSIYQALVSAGLTPAGACGLMGNLQAESAMRANNAQDGMTSRADADYTAAADNGSIDFVNDKVGYGLAQWTLDTRKENLLKFCKARGASVGDAEAQVAFCLHELKTEAEYRTLWSRLCSTDSVYDAAAIVCTKYERPAVNNITERSKYALDFYNQFAGETVQAAPAPDPAPEPEVETVNVKLKTLKRGANCAAVGSLQLLLNGNGHNCGAVDGDFGPKTEAAVKAFQKKAGLSVDGIVGAKTWAALLK